MGFMTVEELAKDIYHESKRDRNPKVEDNSLFQELYACFCRIKEIKSDFVKLVKEEGKSVGLCEDLFKWYDERYRTEFGMGRGVKGQKRSVTRKHTFDDEKSFIIKNKGRRKGEFKKVGSETLYGVYNFDRLYSKNQFKKYLLDSKLESSQYTYEFILHTAVAFFMEPDELNKLLKYYGFQGLHVKNIHHLAVYSVLKKVEMNPGIIERDFNPFKEVREVYQEMQKIINEDKTCSLGGTKKEKVLINTSTTVWKADLMGENNLTKEKLLGKVESNKAVFNMIHSKILRDHRRFAIALSCIYGNAEHEAESEEWSKYSLYSFIKEFGNGIPTQKRLWESLHRHIVSEEKHPTRELMIIFWLYAYCFLYEGEIWISSNTRNAMERKKREWFKNKEQNGSDENKKNDKQLEGGYFDLYAFLTEETLEVSRSRRKKAKDEISGANCIAAINEKLKNYGWGMLDKRRTFDFFIMQLANLTIVSNSKGPSKISYKMLKDEGGREKNIFNVETKELEPISPVDNVPYLLVVIVKILKALTVEANCNTKSEDQKKHFILECRLYEQI